MSNTPQEVRLVMIGLDSSFFPINITDWCRIGPTFWFDPPFPPTTRLVAASKAGWSDEDILTQLDMSPDEYAKKFNIPVYDETEDLLDVEKPHGAFICGRPSKIPAMALQCIQRGIHVFLQKPAALNVAALEEVKQAAQEYGVSVAVGSTMRFDHAVNETISQSQSAEVGNLCSLRVMYNHGMPPVKSWYSDPQEGGPELWLSWYPIDMIRHFSGSEIKSVFARSHIGNGSPHWKETVFHVTCELVNGIHASFDFYGNIAYPYARSEWELLFENGIIRQHQRHAIEVYQKDRPQEAVFRNQFSEFVGQEISAWLNSWDRKKTTGLSLDGTIKIIEVSAAMRQSIQSGQVVDVAR